MKRVFQNIYWIIGFLVAFAGLLLMYLIVDAEPVQASSKYYNDTMLSDTAFEACMEIGQQYNVSPELLMAIIESESTGNKEAFNDGCIGLMQINKKYHAERMKRLGVTDLTDEYSNILVGTDYLAEMFTEEEDVALILSKFHGESRAYDTYAAGELSEYAAKILDRAAEITATRDKFSNAVG